MSFGQVFFIKFVLHLPKWASGDKNFCSTLPTTPVLFIEQKSFFQYLNLQQISFFLPLGNDIVH